MTGPPFRDFSPRELDIMRGIGRGLSYAEIGTELNLSEHTVRAHVRTAALKIHDFPDLAPRWRLFAFVKHIEWTDSHAAKLPKTA